MFDYLIVGAGFAGTVVAERMASAFDKRVLVVDRRAHVGGNAYDCYDANGILVHQYGPHVFHTNSTEVFEYLSRFTEWRPYEHRVLAGVDGQLLPLPINLDTVNRLYGTSLTSVELERFFSSVAEAVQSIRTAEDAIVSKIGRELYEKFFQHYTRKQWGMDASELDASVTRRVPIRTSRDDRYFDDRYQAMPSRGYTEMFQRMLDHPNITVALNTDYRDVAGGVSHRTLVYTGPIDEYFDCAHGPLPYRSLEFRLERRSETLAQPVAVINWPDQRPYTRVTEYKHITGQEHPFTTLVYEYPRSTGEPYYPIPTAANAIRHAQYLELASHESDVVFTGRLGSYRYYNMDQVVAQSLALCARLTGATRREMARR